MKRLALVAVYALLSAVVLLPVLVVQVPALGDSINHIARMHVLTAPAISPLSRFYRVGWQLSPYLAIDAIVPPLARIMPLLVAARVFIGACLLMPVAGVAALQWVVRGRVGFLPAAAFLMSQNYLLALGFLNFSFMAGLAVLLFAAWIGTQAWPRLPRLTIFSAALVVLYLGHIFAALGYCAAVAGYEIARAVRSRFQPLSSVALDFMCAGGQALPTLLLVPFFDRGQVAVGSATTDYGDFAARVTSLASPVLFLADPVNGIVVLGALACVVLLAFRTRIAPAIWPAAAALAGVSLVMPHMLAGVWGTDLRFPLIACMIALGGATLRLPPRAGALALAVIVALTLAKSTDGTIVLRKLDWRAAQTRRVLEALPTGSRLLVMDDTGLVETVPAISPNAFWHIPLMAVIDRDAFVPYLFTGFMTVHPTAVVADASTPSGRPIGPRELANGLHTPATPGDRNPDGAGGRVYWNGWPRKFDFLLVQHASSRSPLPPILQLVASSEVADLYRITPEPVPSPSASP